MQGKTPQELGRFFGFYFYVAAVILFVIATSGTPVFEFRPETIIFSALCIVYVLLLARKRKNRLHHIVLGLVFFAIIFVGTLLVMLLPDLLSKFAFGFGLFALCLSYGIHEGMEARSYYENPEYKVDYQALITDIRSNNKLLSSITHDVTKMLIAQIYQEETDRIFAMGKPESRENLKRELLSQAVVDIMADGYALRILELLQSGEQLSKPVMADLDVMLPLWRKYVLTNTKTPSPEILRDAIKQLATHKGRLEQRKHALTSVSALKRGMLTNSQASLLRLGYMIESFENNYRTAAGKQEIAAIEKTIESEFFTLMKACEKLPIALDGTLGRLLIVDPKKIRFDSYKIHLACTDSAANETIQALNNAGIRAEIVYKDATTVRRYQLFSDAFTSIEPYVEVYLEDAETGLFTSVDLSPVQKFAGFADFHKTTLKGHKIKTVPPSFFLQQIIYCWTDYPETKDAAWADDYTTMRKKYFANKPLEMNPLFAYAFSYKKPEDEKSVITYRDQ